MEIIEYKAINKNSLMGKFNLKITKWGNFIIREITLFSKDGRRWISFPARTYEKDNEKKYFSYMIFEQREVFDQFQEKVLHALDNYFVLHPEAQVVKRATAEVSTDEFGAPPF